VGEIQRELNPKKGSKKKEIPVRKQKQNKTKQKQKA
jgi:hypothetical protein